jgi:hypothetical protein
LAKNLNLFSIVRPFQLRIFPIPADMEPQPNCGDNEYGDKKKREHMLDCFHISSRFVIGISLIWASKYPDKNCRGIYW